MQEVRVPPEWPQIVFAGAAAFDTIVRVPRFPEPDERTIADEFVYAGGGPAATAAVAAARLAIPVAFAGTVGADAEGERIVADLTAEGVDVSAVTTAPGIASGASVAVVDAARGTRAICSRQAPEPELSKAANLIAHATWVHTDHVGWSAVRRYVAATRSRPKISLDAGNLPAGLVLNEIDLFVPTESALCARYSDKQTPAALAAALAEGARAVVATRGAHGAIAATAGGERHEVAGVPTQVHSTLGAGDVFHGALLAGVVRGQPLAKCLSYANTVAALSCRELDGRSGIPTHAEAIANTDPPVPPTTASREFV